MRHAIVEYKYYLHVYLNMSYSIPSSLRYDLLPSSIGEEMQKSITYPVTGTNSVYSSTQDFFIISVPKVSGGSVFDPVNSYLR